MLGYHLASAPLVRILKVDAALRYCLGSGGLPTVSGADDLNGTAQTKFVLQDGIRYARDVAWSHVCKTESGYILTMENVESFGKENGDTFGTENVELSQCFIDNYH